MSFDIPQMHIPDNTHEAKVIEAVVKRDNVTADEAILRILRSVPTAASQQHAPRRSYASFFGSIKGPGAHGSKQAVDRYIEELRNEW